MHDLTILGTPYRQVYAFDAEREAEVPFDPEIRRAELKPEADQDLAVVPPPKAIRPWPALDDTDAPVTLATEAAMLAEHLWTNGWEVEKIAARKSVVSGKSVSVRVDLGGRVYINKKTQYNII